MQICHFLCGYFNPLALTFEFFAAKCDAARPQAALGVGRH